MEDRDGEIHVDTNEARGATSPNILRWMLAIGLLLAIVAMSLAWIIPALMRGHNRDESVSAQIDSTRQNAADTSGVVPPSADTIRGAASGTLDEGAVPAVPNKDASAH